MWKIPILMDLLYFLHLSNSLVAFDAEANHQYNSMWNTNRGVHSGIELGGWNYKKGISISTLEQRYNLQLNTIVLFALPKISIKKILLQQLIQKCQCLIKF